jgi:hypothetical protein
MSRASDRLSNPLNWADEEARLGPALAATVRRLMQRGRATWMLSAVAALLLATGFLVFRLYRPARYTVTPILRVTEGGVRSGAARLSVAALKAYVIELAFRRANLTALMERHPEVFPPNPRDPTLALDRLRDGIDVAISENDFLEDRADTDAPRSARVAIGYTGPTPEIAWNISHDLVNLVIETILAGQEKEIARIETAAASAADAAIVLQERVRQQTVEALRNLQATANPLNPLPPTLRRTAQEDRLRQADQDAAMAQLSLHGARQQQTLHFEVVDSGTLPKIPSKAAEVVGAIVVLFTALLGVWILAGAFDPRVLDSRDLSECGVMPLASLPALPSPPLSRPGKLSKPRV